MKTFDNKIVRKNKNNGRLPKKTPLFIIFHNAFQPNDARPWILGWSEQFAHTMFFQELFILRLLCSQALKTLRNPKDMRTV